jgi:serine/threonine protein kinase
MTNLTLSLSDKLINNRYYLYETVANSNHSQVFLARDFVKHRKCVVKRLDLSFCSQRVRQIRASMFEQEAKTLQQLSGKHDQIGQFYNYFKDGSSSYLVQEWVAGVTLEQKLHQQQKLSESETKSILLHLLSILECIHSQGIVHRDIKPSNIVLRSHDNLPVLIDFGIAQQISDRKAYQSNNRPQLRVVAGTPGYMSSEQAMGQTTYNNDFYSLALTAIHLLTGRSPLNVDFNFPEIFISHDLMEVLSRAISPQPERRFDSAVKMRSALLSSSTTELFNRNRQKSSLKTLKTATVLLLGLLVVASAWGWYKFAAKLEERPPLNFADLFPEESLLPGKDDLKLTENLTENLTKDDATDDNNHIFQNIIFLVGTSNQKILQTLGEPIWRQPGFWTNSVAWSYKNVVSQGIDLGYLFDAQTNKLRQAEIAVPPSTSFKTLQAALISLLGAKIEPDLERGLEAVYQRRQTVYNFTVGDLQGVIQRNQQDRIYMAVWSADFH